MSLLTTRARVWIAFSILCAVWGSSYLFIRISVESISPLALVALRLSIGALTILTLVAMRRASLSVSGRQLGTIAIAGTINSASPFLLISWGETAVPSGLASVLNSTTPIFALLLAGAILKDEPITRLRLAGVIVGFAGVVLLLGKDLSNGTHLSGVLGQAAIVAASVCYAAGAVFVRKVLRGVPSMTIATYVLLVSAAEAVTLSLVFSPPPLTSMPPRVWFAVAWLGMLGSGFAFACAYFVLEHWGASRYTLLTYVLPVIGLTLGVIFLHETLDWHIVAGSSLVLMGILLASMRTAGMLRFSTRAARPAPPPDGQGTAPPLPRK